MYSIRRTKAFEKSFKRLKRAGLSSQILRDLVDIIDTLARGERLSAKSRDHQLKGEYGNYRECHIRGDLLLIYRIEEEELFLLLVDLGTHSQLF